MSLPTSVLQLLVLLCLVLPGITYAAVRTSLKGLRPRDTDVSARILEAVLVGALLDCLYVAAFGGALSHRFVIDGQVQALESRSAGAIVLVLGIAVPATVSYLVYARPELRAPFRSWPKFRLPMPSATYVSTPTAWDYALPMLGDHFVRIRLAQGQWVGGWYSGRSFVSTYPLSRDIYLECQWRMADDGSFEERMGSTTGVWLAVNDSSVVEFLAAPSEDEARSNGDGTP